MARTILTEEAVMANVDRYLCTEDITNEHLSTFCDLTMFTRIDQRVQLIHDFLDDIVRDLIERQRECVCASRSSSCSPAHLPHTGIDCGDSVECSSARPRIWKRSVSDA